MAVMGLMGLPPEAKGIMQQHLAGTSVSPLCHIKGDNSIVTPPPKTLRTDFIFWLLQRSAWPHNKSGPDHRASLLHTKKAPSRTQTVQLDPPTKACLTNRSRTFGHDPRETV